jgi:hypothetical protein
MEETIRQAIDEETLPDDGLTSAMVDEVFFVLQEVCSFLSFFFLIYAHRY